MRKREYAAEIKENILIRIAAKLFTFSTATEGEVKFDFPNYSIPSPRNCRLPSSLIKKSVKAEMEKRRETHILQWILFNYWELKFLGISSTLICHRVEINYCHKSSLLLCVRIICFTLRLCDVDLQTKDKTLLCAIAIFSLVFQRSPPLCIDKMKAGRSEEGKLYSSLTSHSSRPLGSGIQLRTMLPTQQRAERNWPQLGSFLSDGRCDGCGQSFPGLLAPSGVFGCRAWCCALSFGPAYSGKQPQWNADREGRNVGHNWPPRQ